MNGRDEIRDKIREAHAEVEVDGGLSMLGLIHYDSRGQENAIHVLTQKSGAKFTDPEQGADLFWTMARRHAGGLSGAQQFAIVFCYGNSGKPVRSLPFMMAGATAIHGSHGLSTEAPTATGMTQMSMRMAEITLQGAVAERAAILQVMASMLTELRNAHRETTTEARELFLGLRRLAIETAQAQQDQAIKVISAKRNAGLAHEALKLMPAALNGLTGREIFPAATADTAHLRALMLMFDDEQLRMFAKAASQKGPEAEAAVALIVNRLAELRREEAEDAKRLREVVGDRHPDDEAAELDAAGLVDPRRVLQSALRTNGADAGSNGQASSVSEKIVRQLDNAVASAPKASNTPADPFVMRLFEGAGAQEIEMLASMYAARGLTDVADELRTRYRAFQSEAK
jgi:hypothetical protein